MLQSTEDERKPRFYHAWKCEVIQHNHKPNGRKMVEGCKKWQIKSSKWENPLDAPEGLMASCKHGCKGNGGKGPRKVRLTPTTRKFYTYESKEAAEQFCAALNEQEASE